jgi:hypothetical protein
MNWRRVNGFLFIAFSPFVAGAQQLFGESQVRAPNILPKTLRPDDKLHPA